MTFSEWMFNKYGIFPDDLTDDDYDEAYREYEKERGNE